MIDEKAPLAERFEHLFKVISGKRFLNMEGLGNEVPFFICPFMPEETVEVEGLLKQLKKRLELNGVRILLINLYDLSIELLKRRGIFERILKVELAVTKEEFLELLHGVLDPETHLVPAISEKMKEAGFDVMFIAGVGEVYPYIRSHSVLNNLQSKAKERPTVMFFPGAYTTSLEDGASLNLFGRLPNDKYYRAFNIFHFEP